MGTDPYSFHFRRTGQEIDFVLLGLFNVLKIQMKTLLASSQRYKNLKTNLRLCIPRIGIHQHPSFSYFDNLIVGELGFEPQMS